MQARSLGGEDPLEEGMTTHSGILAWRIPWTEEPGGLQSIGLQRDRHDWNDSIPACLNMNLAQACREGSNGGRPLPHEEAIVLCPQGLLWLWLGTGMVLARCNIAGTHMHMHTQTGMCVHTPHTLELQTPKVNSIITDKKLEPGNLHSALGIIRDPWFTLTWECGVGPPLLPVILKVKWRSLSRFRLFAPHGLYLGLVPGVLQDRIPEWVAFPFSRGSSQPRDWTQVSHIAGELFTDWATRKPGLSSPPGNMELKMRRKTENVYFWKWHQVRRGNDLIKQL